MTNDEDIGGILGRMASAKSALNDLVSERFLKAIGEGKFPNKLTDVLVKHCEKNSCFLPYLTAAMESGNNDLAKNLYDAGISYWERIGDFYPAANLADAYGDKRRFVRDQNNRFKVERSNQDATKN